MEQAIPYKQSPSRSFDDDGHNHLDKDMNETNDDDNFFVNFWLNPVLSAGTDRVEEIHDGSNFSS